MALSGAGNCSDSAASFDIMRARLNENIEDVLLPLMTGKSSNICLINPPDYPNVGDSAILLGQLDFIQKHFSASGLCFFDFHSYSYSADDLIDKCSIILINGGGSFGDLWPHHHALRLRILERFNYKSIIQLPQSIYFDNGENLNRTAALIVNQKDFHLLVRDFKSSGICPAQFFL